MNLLQLLFFQHLKMLLFTIIQNNKIQYATDEWLSYQ